MSGTSEQSPARLLLLLAEFVQTVNAALSEVVDVPELVGNAPILVLCSLDLHGPMTAEFERHLPASRALIQEIVLALGP